MIRLFPILLVLATAGAASESVSETWEFLDNGTIRIGVNRSAGGAIGWFSESGREENLIDRYDYGRYFQQSWYGTKDESDWNGKPWRWNPVQAGDWTGQASPVVSFDRSEDRISIETIPRHWANGELLEEVRFRQTVRLDGPVAVIDFFFSYDGTKSHSLHDQEMPAVFVAPRYRNLRFMNEKGEIETVVPAWPNERYSIAEPWIAYVDEEDRGIGVLVPGIGVEEITAYRAPGDPANRDKAACSYVAPLIRTAIEPGFRFEYRAYLTTGTFAEIRKRFSAVAATN